MGGYLPGNNYLVLNPELLAHPDHLRLVLGHELVHVADIHNGSAASSASTSPVSFDFGQGLVTGAVASEALDLFIDIVDGNTTVSPVLQNALTYALRPLLDAARGVQRLGRTGPVMDYLADALAHASQELSSVLAEGYLNDPTEVRRLLPQGSVYTQSVLGAKTLADARSIIEGVRNGLSARDESVRGTPPAVPRGTGNRTPTNAVPAASGSDRRDGGGAGRGQGPRELGRGSAASAIRELGGLSDGASGLPARAVGAPFSLARDQTRQPATYEELLQQATTGEAPASQKPGRLAGYRDWVLDSTAPFLDMVKDRRHAVYRAFNTALNQQAVRMTDAAQLIDTEVLKPMAQTAKAVNVAPEQFVVDVGNYALFRYAPQGNEELRLRHEANLAEAKVAVATAQREVANDPTNRAYRATLASVEADLREAQTWLDRHALVDNVVRGAPGVGTLHLQRKDSDQFIGGLTTAEANAVRQALEQRYGASLPELVKMADLLTGAMRDTTQRAIDAGAIRQDELPGYSTSKDWVPTTGTGEIDDGTQSELLFNSGLQGLKDKQRKGRSTISDNAVEAVVRKIMSLERQIAMRPFTEVLANHDGQFGIHVVPTNDPLKGIPYKREADLDPADPAAGTRTHTMKIVFDSEKAMDAVLGANRERANSVALATVGRYTRWTAYMVTRAVPVFAPISGFKDVVERAVNIIANSGEKVRPVQLLAAVTAGYVSPANMWAAGKSITGKWGNSQAEKDAQELMQHTGFLTRNTVLSNDMDALASDVARAAGGLKHKSTVMRWLHNYNEMFERTAQLSVYRALIAQGLAPAVAADTMLEAMNLNKTGRFSPVMQVFFPFFGARMSGAHQVLRNMGSVRGMATLGTLTAAGMLLYAMSSALGGDDPGDDEEGLAQNRMDSLSGVTLARGIPIWTGEDGKFVKIPVPYGLGFVGWNLAVALSRLANGTFSPVKAMEHAGIALMDEVSPFAPSPADIMKTDRRFNRMRPSIAPRKRHQAG
jgi:hypothetical protein